MGEKSPLVWLGSDARQSEHFCVEYSIINGSNWLGQIPLCLPAGEVSGLYWINGVINLTFLFEGIRAFPILSTEDVKV